MMLNRDNYNDGNCTLTFASIRHNKRCACFCASDPFFTDKSNAFGANPVIESESFQKIDLLVLLHPEASESLGQIPKLPAKQIALAKGFAKFYEGIGSDEDKGKLRRNAIQDRILGASKQRCGHYKNLLKALDARTNTILGIVTTALAGAGAIFTPANTVRALSGTAAIISGSRAEFNENYFANQTIQACLSG